MLKNILICWGHIPKESSVKRTTIILEEQDRKYTDSLIREGKETGIKPLISKMLDIYCSRMVYDWRYPGEYYGDISRMAFVNVEFINILLRHISEEKWREVGQKIGEAAKVSIEATLNLQTTERSGQMCSNGCVFRVSATFTSKTSTL